MRRNDPRCCRRPALTLPRFSCQTNFGERASGPGVSAACLSASSHPGVCFEERLVPPTGVEARSPLSGLYLAVLGTIIFHEMRPLVRNDSAPVCRCSSVFHARDSLAGAARSIHLLINCVTMLIHGGCFRRRFRLDPLVLGFTERRSAGLTRSGSSRSAWLGSDPGRELLLSVVLVPTIGRFVCLFVCPLLDDGPEGMCPPPAR